MFLTIILCERFGSPIMKSTSVVLGLLVGCIVAAACGYFDRSGIDSAPAVSFIWVKTFKLQIYGPLVLPMLAVFIICAIEAIGDVSERPLHDSGKLHMCSCLLAHHRSLPLAMCPGSRLRAGSTRVAFKAVSWQMASTESSLP